MKRAGWFAFLVVFLWLLPLTVVSARPPVTLEFADVTTGGVQGNGESFLAHFSHDARYVAFYSRASNLSPADTNVFVDLFLRDLTTNTTTHIAPILTNAAVVPLHRPEFSSDGNWIVFESHANLVAGDTNGTQDTYLYHIPTAAFQLISSGTGGADSGNPSVSYSSCFVVYDVNLSGVFMYDRATGLSLPIAAGALDPHISADGSQVVYARLSDRELFLYNWLTDTTTPIGDRGIAPDISADGSLVVYSSDSTPRLAMAYDRLANTFTNLSPTGGGADSGDVSVSADGTWVVYGSFANDLVPPPDSNSMDTFAYNTVTNTLERLSYRIDGTEANNRTDIPIISGNGQRILFQTFATNYITPDTNGGLSDVIVANYGLGGAAAAAPTDGNCLPEVSISGVSVNEAAGNATFTLTLNIPLRADVTFDISSTDGSAVDPGDYTAIPAATTVTIPARTTTFTFDVPILDDLLVEPTETFTVTISNPSLTPVRIITGSATGTITDNDRVVVPPGIPPVGGGSTSATSGGSVVGAAPAITIFDPAISKLGFLVPGQVGVTGEQLEWVVTVTNPGSIAGTNVTITDTLDSRLAIDRVNAPGASVTISGQTVTVIYPVLNAGERVQFSIFTTTLEGVNVTNTACVTADNLTVPDCATGLVVTRLPTTGEIPWWRAWIAAVPFVIGLAIIRAGFRR